MNTMDLVMQMNLAAAQIAQNTIPQVSSQQTSESGQDFKSLMQDKKAQDSQNTQKTQDTKDTQDSHKSQETEKDGSAGKTEEPEKETAVAEQAAAMQAANPAYVQVMDVNLTQEPVNGLQLVSVEDVTQAANPATVANTVAEQPAAAAGTVQQAAAQQQLPEQQSVQETPVPQQTETQTQPVEVQAVQAKPEGQQAQAETFAQTAQDDSGEPEMQAAVTSAQQPLFSETETMPVKVGDGDTIDTQQPDFDAKLTQNVEKALSQGEQRVEIRLNPENLGSVVVEMTRSQDGSLHVVLHTETEHAARLLGEHSNALGLMLQSSSQGEVRVEVRQPQQETQQWQHPDQEGGQNHGGQQQEQQQNHRQNTEDFLQQLRLGLFSMEPQED